MGGEYSMKTNEMEPGSWNQGGQALEEFQRGHDDMGGAIVDFYSPKVKLVIEVDGSQHLEPENIHKDLARKRDLENQGLLVLRFNNLQVLQEIDAVMEVIFETVGKRLRSEKPSLH